MNSQKISLLGAGAAASNDAARMVDLDSYLPLSAGSGKPLSGDLYMGNNDIVGVGNINMIASSTIDMSNGDIINVYDIIMRTAGDGNIDMNGGKISDLAEATLNGEAVRYQQLAGFVANPLTSDLDVDNRRLLNVFNINASEVFTNADYLNIRSQSGVFIIATFAAISDVDGGIVFNVDLDMNTHKITGVVDPTANQEAATKKYVDDNIGGGGLWQNDASNAWLTAARYINLQTKSIFGVTELTGTTTQALTVQAGTAQSLLLMAAGQTVSIWDTTLAADFDSAGIGFHRTLDMNALDIINVDEIKASSASDIDIVADATKYLNIKIGAATPLAITDTFVTVNCLYGLNLQNHRIYNIDHIRLRELTADITSPSEGTVYYNTTSNVLKYYDGSAWKTIATV